MAPSKKNNIDESEGSMAYCIETSNIYGRYLVAARDIKPGEIIIKEYPLVVGPQMDSSPICFSCYRLLGPKPVPCSKCEAVYLCSPSCETNGDHIKFECQYLKSAKVTDIFKENQIILPFRCLLLRHSQNYSSKWDALMSLQSHENSRRNSAIWRSHQKHVIQVMKDKGLLFLEEDTEEEILQKICGILDVNSFEVRRPYGSERLRALYHNSSLMAHDCVGNTHIAVDENFCITVRASISIMKGEPVLFNYTSALQGTEERQEHLKEGKYFECHCRRCIDPTELGSHMSSIRCTRCRDGLVCPTELPVIMSGHWICRQCGHKYTRYLIQTTIGTARLAIEQVDRESIYQMEKLLSKLLHSFPPHHGVVLELKQILIAMYRDSIQSEENPCRKLLARKIELCKDLLPVLRTLEPGISRLTGIALYELHIPTVMLANHDYHSGAIQTMELLEQLGKAENYLKEAVQYLLYEPPHTPEGQLARIAMQDLKALRVNIGHIYQVRKSENQDKVECNSITNMESIKPQEKSDTINEIQQITNNNLQINKAKQVDNVEQIKQVDKVEETTAENNEINKKQGQENIASQVQTNDTQNQNKAEQNTNRDQYTKKTNQNKPKPNKNNQHEAQRNAKTSDDHQKCKMQKHNELEQHKAGILQTDKIQKEIKIEQNSNRIHQAEKSEKELQKQSKNSYQQAKGSSKQKKATKDINNTDQTIQKQLQESMVEKIHIKQIDELQKNDKPEGNFKDINHENEPQEQQKKTIHTSNMQQMSILQKENELENILGNMHNESQKQKEVKQTTDNLHKINETSSKKDKSDYDTQSIMQINESQRDGKLEQNINFNQGDKSQMPLINKQNTKNVQQISNKTKDDVLVNKIQQNKPQKINKQENNFSTEKINDTERKNKTKTFTNSTHQKFKSEAQTKDKNVTTNNIKPNSKLKKQDTLDKSKIIQRDNKFQDDLNADTCNNKIQLISMPQKENSEKVLEENRNKLKDKSAEQNDHECKNNQEGTKTQKDKEIDQKNKNDPNKIEEEKIRTANENELSNKSQEDKIDTNNVKKTNILQIQIEKEQTEDNTQQIHTPELQNNTEQRTNRSRKGRNKKKKASSS